MGTPTPTPTTTRPPAHAAPLSVAASRSIATSTGLIQFSALSPISKRHPRRPTFGGGPCAGSIGTSTELHYGRDIGCRTHRKQWVTNQMRQDNGGAEIHPSR